MNDVRWIVMASLLAGLLVLGLVGTHYFGLRHEKPLSAVRSWHYQLQSLDLDRLARNSADLLVVDFSQSQGQGKAMRPLEPAEVERLKTKPGGGRRIVLAYLSIGEAEEYRYYWNANWKSAPPSWLIAENCRWPRNHLVRFWEDAWKDIMIRGDGSYLGRIEGAGFDGVFLDRVDVYQDIQDRFPEARIRMIEFVAELRRALDRRRPGMLVVAQNAEDLLDSTSYRASLDGVSKEDLIYGLKGTGRRNEPNDIGWSKQRLELMRKDGKPVFVTEYLTTSSTMAVARRELEAEGYVPTFPPRALDGGDPHQERPPGDLLREYGTPEYTAEHCNGVWKKG